MRGRPKEYSAAQLLPPLKVIWLAALQPCGERLKAALPDWLPAYEADHRRLDTDVRQALLTASRATLDRLLIPARVAHRRRAATRPGSRLRAEIPIRTAWPENAPGYLEMDTVARCGGALDDRHGWRFDAMDVHTTWSVLRGRPNRSAASVGGHKDDLAARSALPPARARQRQRRRVHQPLTGALLRDRTPPVTFTRARPYRKNDQAHVEQKNFTNVRLWFGYERYDHPDLWRLINTLCRGALHQLLNYFLPTMKQAKKGRVGSKTVWTYGPTQTPLERVLACAEVSAATQAQLRAEKAALNPFALRREVDRQMKAIEAVRRAPPA